MMLVQVVGLVGLILGELSTRARPFIPWNRRGSGADIRKAERC